MPNGARLWAATVNFEASDDLISHAVSEELQPDSKNFEAGTAGQGEKTKG
jgi:hypothetical protein